jgi:hypothetical protein
MKRSGTTVVCITMITLFLPFAGGKEPIIRRGQSVGEPFVTFRILDERLTRLATQQRSIQALFEGGHSNAGHEISGKRPWAEPAHAMNTTNLAIQRILIRGESLYRIRHRRFGVRLFRILRIRAEAVQRDIVAVQTARNKIAAESAQRKLSNSILSLTLQFQAASGGYESTNCSRKAWTCCEPKKTKDLREGEQAACRWVCVQKPLSCAGFVGPRIR